MRSTETKQVRSDVPVIASIAFVLNKQKSADDTFRAVAYGIVYVAVQAGSAATRRRGANILLFSDRCQKVTECQRLRKVRFVRSHF